MKIQSLTALLALTLCCPAISEENAHSQHGHGQETKAPVAKPEKKYAVDENLKPRMEQVLNTMLELDKSKKPKKAQLSQAGKKIESTVQDIFKSCHLSPDADAAIHPILADILSGASLLKKGDGKTGHEKIHHALLRYEEFFDHPEWKHHAQE